MPAAIGGFRPDTLLASLFSVLSQFLRREVRLENCYPEVVQPGGNARARHILKEVMDVVDANWRGIGVIPKSGFALSQAYAAHDARRVLPSFQDKARKRIGEMPPGCDCARVVLGKLYPNECRLYAKACTPRTPIGPCMVSDEGACRIWWASGLRENVWNRDKARQTVS
jgi:hydrogenase expression/formation protein HypD